MATGTVTIEKSYFETLLRRAQFHTSGIDFTTPVNLPTVTIPKLDHDSLLNSAREYGQQSGLSQPRETNLRRNLYKGGVNDETLALLTQDDDGHTFDPNDGMMSNFTSVDFTSESAAFQTQRLQDTPQPSSASKLAGQDHTHGRKDNQSGCYGYPTGVTNASNTWDNYSVTPDGHQIDGYFEGTNDPRGQNQNQTRHQQFPKNAKRSIILTNLPDATTYADVVDVVRGGMLLDIFLRSNDRSCVVSFLEEDHARNFFHYMKRNDLYLRNKRVDVRWHDRQFVLPGHVANKIGTGATRNLVIRNAGPKHTEEIIRDDLEHIHNLVVISVKLSSGNVHISTNSVHNAIFARTCMMSRAVYKGCKINWENDECAVLLPKAQKRAQEDNVPSKKTAPIINRFELLHLDGAENSSLDGDQEHFQAKFSPKEGIFV